MAEYQKIEYRIGKDGKITETVIGATGSSCTETTKGLEKALGEVDDRELLPDYYEGEETITSSQTTTLNQI
ncbi:MULTISPECIES: DUF2997 domain-containing protein [unclassified Coleofasciculus]|uniref:DUF2997 domain-containing protein n=1 Tax=unclassified Coleofasciculus TaxID=2692782 RepID=UPI00187FA147|nr:MULTISPECIES: DUF2997 domain-containing protein [unclassified Coleofasciculus]MBE9128972.1 DUF2997 domain-containing protein [Coleofasciculus sp. LEGE 07081]MBE9148970.1 DUF2997 domain-containing protein [Coleofasciculus sp. LEGE 07092]